MAGVRVWDGDLTKMVHDRCKQRAFNVEPVKMTISVEVKEIVEVLQDDGMLKMEMYEAASEVMKTIADAAAKVLKAKSEDAQKAWHASLNKIDFEDELKAFVEKYQDLAAEAPKKVQEATRKVWEAYTKTNKEYSKYKWKVIGKVGLCVAGVGTGIAVAASAGLGNIPGLIAGTIGAARSLSTGLQTLVAVARSAESIGLELRKDVDALVADYKDMGKSAVTAKEIFAKGVDAFTTKSLTSIKKCENNLTIFKGKIASLKKDAHKAASDLDKLLDGNERIEKEIKAIKAKGIESTLIPVLAKAEQNVNAMIEKISELVERVKKGREAAEKTDKLVAELKKKVNDKVYTAASVAIDVSVLALEIWGGFGAEGGAEAVSKFLEDPAEKAEVVAIGLKVLSDAVEDIESQMKG